MAYWDFDAKLCGNCRYWELLAGSQKDWDDGEWRQPYGVAGYNTDGKSSPCRRHAPIQTDINRYPGETAVWPNTKRTDWCGDFDARAGERKLKQDYHVGGEGDGKWRNWRGEIVR